MNQEGMNQILTDEEITLVIRECARGSAINRDGSTSHRIARAIEQAILNKLGEQKPVAEVVWYDPVLSATTDKAGKIIDASMSFIDTADLGTKLYLHPTPTEVEALKLDAAQSRIELLEHDAKTGDYETLYAQTVVELPAAQDSEDELLEALETLACLGNGNCYGNSHGNVIAQQAIANHKARKESK